ncbi:MAG: hypothetical protein R3D66_01745 [Alphaproteobacteria bacterium]
MALQEFYSTDLESAMTNPGAAGLTGILGSTVGALEEQANSGRFAIDPVLQEKAGPGRNLVQPDCGTERCSHHGNFQHPAADKISGCHGIRPFQKRQQDQSIPLPALRSKLANGDTIIPPRPEDSQTIDAMVAAFKFWQADGHTTSTHSAPNRKRRD